jgi:hypothetical protein
VKETETSIEQERDLSMLNVYSPNKAVLELNESIVKRAQVTFAHTIDQRDKLIQFVLCEH